MVILFALFGMVCWGLAPLFGKLGLAGVHPVTALSLRTLLAATLVLGWVVGTRAYHDFSHVPPLFWVFIAVEALLAAVIGDLAYFVALKYGNVNQVSLVMACAPVVTLVASYFAFGETASIHQLIGALLISVGLALVCVD